MQRSRSTSTMTVISRSAGRRGSTDWRLGTEMILLAIETLGTAWEELQELGKALKRSFETTVLPVDYCSAAADFHNTWVYRLSTTIQRGTAEIKYNVVQGNRAPLSAIRIAKDGGASRGSASQRP